MYLLNCVFNNIFHSIPYSINMSKFFRYFIVYFTIFSILSGIFYLFLHYAEFFLYTKSHYHFLLILSVHK